MSDLLVRGMTSTGASSSSDSDDVGVTSLLLAVTSPLRRGRATRRGTLDSILSSLLARGQSAQLTTPAATTSK